MMLVVGFEGRHRADEVMLDALKSDEGRPQFLKMPLQLRFPLRWGTGRHPLGACGDPFGRYPRRDNQPA